MRTMILLLLLAVLPRYSPAQQTSQPDQATRQDGVTQRGDHVMGFSHDLTAHHFRLLKDGGEIIVEANDPNDKTSIEQIRIHLTHIVGMFSKGDFDAPMLIHDTNPPGVATMTRLKSDIRYTITDTQKGAKIRILTSSPETTDAVHAFLLFQIVDHHTGDAPNIAG
ncbi:MAG: hypothetical protein WBL50_00205 [Candidatus Acidiferrum sp.]